MIIAGWLGAILVLVGYILNAQKVRLSWLIWVVGNGLVATYSYSLSAYPTVLMSLIIMFLNIYGYVKWKKE